MFEEEATLTSNPLFHFQCAICQILQSPPNLFLVHQTSKEILGLKASVVNDLEAGYLSTFLDCNLAHLF